ncbi:hypothetical protein ACPUVO_02340 [Pseudocolwellia sp. HL-MZ19]|uniref:hypothetical protein n=1 Tax=Pseudocolwellia sp. HL-MZ19 TaxID=3400846 RepID=UPI003CF194C5
MSKSKGFLIAGLAILVIAVVYLISIIEWNMVEEEIGLTREAEKEPLLAASLFLESYQKDLTTITTPESFFKDGTITLSKDSSLLIDEAALVEYDGIIPALVTWVKQGGHLVYTLSPRREQLDLEYNDVIALSEITVIDAEEIAFRESVLETPVSNGMITDDDHSFSVHLAHRFTFENCAGLDIAKKDSEATLICEMGVNDGYITFLPSINAISNDGLRHLDHGEYLLWLIGKNNKLVYLPSTQSTSWAVLLWQWSWQVVLLTFLLSLLLMWQLSMRLGLAVEPSKHAKNLFAKHIEAVGNFLFKYQHHDVLKNALLIDLVNAVEKRHPKYKQLNLNEQASLISSLTGKSTSDIYLLLSEPLPEDENQRIKFIKLFKELRNLL